METQSNKITYEWDGVLRQYNFHNLPKNEWEWFVYIFLPFLRKKNKQ